MHRNLHFNHSYASRSNFISTLNFLSALWFNRKTGGSAWESNPPRTLLEPATGFEVQEGHRNPWRFLPLNSEVFSRVHELMNPDLGAWRRSGKDIYQVRINWGILPCLKVPVKQTTAVFQLRFWIPFGIICLEWQITVPSNRVVFDSRTLWYSNRFAFYKYLPISEGFHSALFDICRPASMPRKNPC